MEDSGAGRALQCRRSNPNDLAQKDKLNHTKNKKAESHKSKKNKNSITQRIRKPNHTKNKKAKSYKSKKKNQKEKGERSKKRKLNDKKRKNNLSLCLIIPFLQENFNAGRSA